MIRPYLNQSLLKIWKVDHMSYNKTISEGRITRELKLEKTKTGTPFCNFDLAMDSGFGKNKRTTFITVTVWGKQAEFVSKYFEKGHGILVEGRIDQDIWKDKNTGEKKSRHRITAERVQFPLSNKNQKTVDPTDEEEAQTNYSDTSPGWPTGEPAEL